MRANRKDSLTKSRFAWPRLSPSSVVGLVAVLVGLLLLFGNDLKRFFSDRLDSRISFQQGGRRSTQTGAAENKKRTSSVIFDGEVYRTEGRLREASAVAIAASLTGVASASEGRPVRDVAELLKGIKAQGLLPPGIEFIPDRNLLVSEHSTIHVRLRLRPFSVEVLSLGRERLDGAALLLRVPDEQQSPKQPARYFYSLRLEDIKVPEPFVNASAVLACGWQMDTIRPELPEGAKPEQLTVWADSQLSR
jgi:hypothetical protein